MRLIVAIFFLPMGVLAQADRLDPGSRSVSGYMSAFQGAGGENSIQADKVFSFFDKLTSKRVAFKNEHLFLNHVFVKTHQRFLKQFKPFARFDELLDEGDYNCLTATALYGLILQHLGFEFSMVETNYHIFLLVESANGKVLFETTDQLHGFVTGDVEIEKRISAYKLDNVATTGSRKVFYSRNTALYNSIDLENMLGLLHFNIAVEAFNNNNLITSVNHLEKTIEYYDSPRIDEFSRIIALRVLEGGVSSDEKGKLLNRIRNIRHSESRVVASVRLRK